MILKGITWDHPRGFEPLAAAALQYERSFGIRVEWQKRSLALFGDQSLADLSRDFDLLIIDHPHVGMMAFTGCISAVDRWINKNELLSLGKASGEPSFSSYFYRDHQWALPVDGAVQTAAYRPDLLLTLPVPQNWNQVFQLAETLKKRNLKVGMALCPTDCLCSFLSVTAQLGSPIREGNARLTDTKIGVRALEHLRRLRDLMPQEVLDWNPIQLYDYMSEQDGLAYSPLGFCYTNYSRKGFRNKILFFANPPGISHAVLGGAGISISASSAHPKEAAQFAYWICTGEIQNDIYVKSQGQPAHQQAWHDENANKLTNNFFYQCLDSLQTAYVRPRYKGWPVFQQKLGEAIHHFLLNDLDPSIVLKQLQEQYSDSYSFAHP